MRSIISRWKIFGFQHCSGAVVVGVTGARLFAGVYRCVGLARGVSRFLVKISEIKWPEKYRVILVLAEAEGCSTR